MVFTRFVLLPDVNHKKRMLLKQGMGNEVFDVN